MGFFVALPCCFCHQPEHLCSTSLTCQLKAALVSSLSLHLLRQQIKHLCAASPHQPGTHEPEQPMFPHHFAPPFSPEDLEDVLSSTAVSAHELVLSPFPGTHQTLLFSFSRHIAPVAHTSQDDKSSLKSPPVLSVHFPLSCRAISTEDKCCQFNF